jgi:hypothetical protein
MNLENIEARILGMSQKGQDSFIDYIIKNIKIDNKFFVEFGGADGFTSCNTYHLRNNLSWNGILFDPIAENKSINLYKEFLTVENCKEIFFKYKIPENLGFLCIDIDGNDFHIANELLKYFKPSFLMIETNVRFDPYDSFVQRYIPNRVWDGKSWYGASPLATKKMLETYGYSVVKIHLDDLIAVRNDLLDVKNLNSWDTIYSKSNHEIYKSHGSPAININDYFEY